MRTITEIIIHCTATTPSASCTVESIRRYHLSLGWRDIGYHYVIYPDGSVNVGRPIEEPGAHTTGHNANSIGIAYVGGLDSSRRPSDTRTPNQRVALLQLVKDLMEEHNVIHIHGHNEYANKACPCFNVQQWRKENGI
ncbi:MAG: N-acetylmuramoyl-L-alanine amidase [Bacteroidales bacterium]|nr:N-acetylmuramoyl-L-alanine amidase [Candidatus Colimorpha pelethequi]